MTAFATPATAARGHPLRPLAAFALAALLGAQLHCPVPIAAHDLMDTLLDEFLVLNGARAEAVGKLGANATGWGARQAATKAHLAQLFAPLPTTPAPMPFNVTGTIHHPAGFAVKKILYQTRPGLFVSASLWVPDGVEERAASPHCFCAPTWFSFL